MSLGTRIQAACWMAAACLALSACATATQVAEVQVVPTTDLAIAASARATSQAADEQTRVAAGIAATLTAQPTATDTPLPTATNTATPAPTATNTAQPTETAVPATAVPTKAAAVTHAPANTQPAATAAATKPPAPPASVYSSTGGPEGFFTDITCKRGGAECTPVMPPGDINFDMVLGSSDTAPWTVFDPYGLAVERDGVNISKMFMFVDAGWLEPGRIVSFGASRNFTEPGRYVIRSSGCYTDGSTDCGWSTFAGSVVNFVIQP